MANCDYSVHNVPENSNLTGTRAQVNLQFPETIKQPGVTYFKLLLQPTISFEIISMLTSSFRRSLYFNNFSLTEQLFDSEISLLPITISILPITKNNTPYRTRNLFSQA